MRAISASTFSDLFVLDAEVGGDHLGIVAHVLGRAVRDLAAVLQDDHVVGDLHHHRHVVLDEQDRGAVLGADRAQEGLEIRRLARVEAGRRLVQAQHGGLAAHGARDLEPPLGTVGKIAGRIIGALDQADLVEPEAGALDGLGLGVAVARRPSRPAMVQAEASISALCWATIRFSSTVMPANRRMFWKVRATRALAAIS